MFPAVHIPFPVKPVYRIMPDMSRLGQELFGELQTQHFLLDKQFPAYLAEKLRLLRLHSSLCRALADDADEQALANALWRVFGLLAHEQPEFARAEMDGVSLLVLGLRLRFASHEERVCPRLEPINNPGFPDLSREIHRHLAEQRGVTRLLDALALSVQEDLVIMRLRDEQDDAEALQVCFPSHWNPAEKAGQSFAQIHRPVAHSASLVAASSNVMRALVNKGPFVRFVWSIVSNESLSQNPALPTYRKPLTTAELQEPEHLIQRLFFRVERQTTYPLADLQRSLFTIRIFRTSLREALCTQERKDVLEQSLLSMDDELLAYKNLTDLRAPLLAWLRA